MTRVTPVAIDELPDMFKTMLAQAEDDNGNPILSQVMALAPDLFSSYFKFYYSSHESGIVEASTKELARLKIARLNGCNTCKNARYAAAIGNGLDEDKICQLDLPEDTQHLSKREKLAVLYAEKMALDHQSIDDSFVEQLKTEFTDPEIVELGMMIGQYIGFGRLLVALGIGDAESEPYWATRHRSKN